MSNFKKACITLMAVAATMSCVACGAVDEGAEKSASHDFKSFSDVFDATSDFSAGSYSMELKSGEKDAFNLSGKTDGKGFIIDSIGVTSGETNFSVNNLITATPERLYVNADSIFSLAGAESDLGYYGVLLPDVSDSEDSLQADILSFEKDFVETVFSGCDVTAGGNTVSVKVDTKDEFKSVTVNTVNYILDNKEKINSLVDKCSGSFDTDSYVTALIDDIYPDLSEAYNIITGESFEDVTTKDELLESAHSYDEAVSGTGDWSDSFSDMKEELDGFTDEDWNELYAGVDGSYVEVSITVNGDVLTVNGDVHVVESVDEASETAERTNDIAPDDTAPVEESVSFTYTFTKGDVEVTAPDKVTSLKEMATFCKDNPDVIESVGEKIADMIPVPVYTDAEFEPLDDEFGEDIDSEHVFNTLE